MPVSKGGKPYYTREQLEAAKRCGALDYARSAGYDLVREGAGGRYHLREHDSMIFLADGRWYWNSRHRSGRALDFIIYYEGRSLLEAVLLLTEGTGRAAMPPSELLPEPKEKIPFELPEQAPSWEWRRLFAYLAGARGLDQEILRTLIREHRLYLSKEERDGKEGQITVYNAVFVGFGPDGEPASAFKRGILTGSKYKAEVPGSDKRYPFAIPAAQERDANALLLFEGAIDAISQATVEKAVGRPWRSAHRMATGGNYQMESVTGCLAAHPKIRRVGLGFDNDAAGRRLAEYTRQGLAGRGLDILDLRPPQGAKDWNEFLLRMKEE